jgi:hypothetical protein
MATLAAMSCLGALLIFLGDWTGSFANFRRESGRHLKMLRSELECHAQTDKETISASVNNY